MNVDGGVGKDRSLNGKCEDVYKQPKANINTQSTHDPNKYLEDEVWRYCSLLSKKPKTIEEAKTTDTYKTENTYGKQYKDKLIDPKHEDNEDFWNLKNAEFLGLKGAKAKREQVTNSNSIFYNANKSVKQLCNIAYFETTNGNSTPLEDVFKFCSLKGEQ
ncbi:hypothetical protein [Candidatus Mycoplasma haematohominis]|uniref:hypothetical protein n=1 Tax=Candidatus Mycoplasma haematohominis TaxID=1494318 RepID=UPI001C0A6C2A|nr:hypothetical protein [Candidatus Mycoplasma haemohominis]